MKPIRSPAWFYSNQPLHSAAWGNYAIWWNSDSIRVMYISFLRSCMNCWPKGRNVHYYTTAVSTNPFSIFRFRHSNSPQIEFRNVHQVLWRGAPDVSVRVLGTVILDRLHSWMRPRESRWFAFNLYHVLHIQWQRIVAETACHPKEQCNQKIVWQLLQLKIYENRLHRRSNGIVNWLYIEVK